MLAFLVVTLAGAVPVQEVGVTEEKPMSQNSLEETTPPSAETQLLLTLVDKAAALLASKGNAAFAEFRQKNSQWYTDKTYIFVDDMEGTALVNPPQTQIEGKNFIDMKDVNGKAVMQEMIDILKTREAGWLEYWWPKPGETKPSKKTNYIKKVIVGGEAFIIGAGLYID
jgi:signal transduction histidine kinase